MEIFRPTFLFHHEGNEASSSPPSLLPVDMRKQIGVALGKRWVPTSEAMAELAHDNIIFLKEMDLWEVICQNIKGKEPMIVEVTRAVRMWKKLGICPGIGDPEDGGYRPFFFDQPIDNNL